MEIRIYLVDGAAESFVQTDQTKAEKVWKNIDLGRLFTQQRIVIAGTYSKSVLSVRKL